MPIAIKSVPSRTNVPVTFDFEDDVVSYVVGIAYWRFAFGGSDDHHVLRLGMSLLNSKPTRRQIVSTVVARLQDGAGHTIDDAASSITLVCIAETTLHNSFVALTSVDNVQSGSNGGNVALPSSSLVIGQAFLSGWNLSHSADDHHMKRLQLAAGLVPDGNVGRVSASAQMADGSGHYADGTINGGVVATSDASTGLLSRYVSPQQTTGPVTVGFGRNLKAGAVVLQGLVASFSGDDHHIRTIGGGVSGWRVSGSDLLLDNARAFMTDDSGHSQDNANSYVTLAAFAVPG